MITFQRSRILRGRLVIMLRSKYQDLFSSDELQRFAPGLYVDLLGGGYFYLSGMFGAINKHVFGKNLMNSPAFLTDVLEELRRSLEEMYWIELTD